MEAAHDAEADQIFVQSELLLHTLPIVFPFHVNFELRVFGHALHDRVRDTDVFFNVVLSIRLIAFFHVF